MSVDGIWLIGLGGPVVASCLLGIAAFLYLALGAPRDEDGDVAGDASPARWHRRAAAWLLWLAVVGASLAGADAALALLLSEPVAPAALAGLVAGAAVSPLLLAGVMSAVMSRLVLAVPFAANLVALAALS